MISEQEAVQIAIRRITPYFDVENLKPEAHLADGKWIVQFSRVPVSPGGAPRVTIDAATGEVLEVFSTQ